MTTIAASKIATIGPTIGKTLPGAPTDPILDPDHPNLLFMYTMDNISGAILEDESPNNNDGTITGANAVAGKIGNALNLGANKTKFIALGKPWGVDNTGAICFWHKSNALNDTNRVFANIDANFFNGSSIVVQTNNTVRFLHDGAVILSAFSTSVVETSYTFWVVQCPPGGPVEMYKNAVKETLTGSTINDWMNNLPTNAVNHHIGLMSDGTTSFGEGDFDLDQYRYFNRVLTQTEIDALFNGGVGA
jgi:hypothetical protein